MCSEDLWAAYQAAVEFCLLSDVTSLRLIAQGSFDMNADAQHAIQLRPGSHLVFVYGSLMPDLHNHHYMQQSTYLKSCSTLPEYTMYSLGSFPGVCEGGTTAIQGVLYCVDARTLSKLDQLEDHPNWYKRKVVQLPDVLSQNSAWMYILPQHELQNMPASVVPNGDWDTFQDTVLTRQQQNAPQP